MAKRTVRWMVVLAALVPLLGGWLAAQRALQKTHTPPAYCQPCLFYGGDFDALDAAANALINDNDSYINGKVYVPFTVPEQQKWEVTGLFVNLIDGSGGTAVPAKVKWEIRKGVVAGHAGTLLASGTANSSFGGNVDCAPIDSFCFALAMKGIKVSLPTGRYWLAVVPQCKKTSCDGQWYAMLDAEDHPPKNHFGPLEPWDDSFFSSRSIAGYFFAPTWGACAASGGIGCDRFSAGVLGNEGEKYGVGFLATQQMTADY